MKISWTMLTLRVCDISCVHLFCNVIIYRALLEALSHTNDMKRVFAKICVLRKRKKQQQQNWKEFIVNYLQKTWKIGEWNGQRNSTTTILFYPVLSLALCVPWSWTFFLYILFTFSPIILFWFSSHILGFISF